MSDLNPTVYRGGVSPRTPSRTRRGLQLLREVSRWALMPPPTPPSTPLQPKRTTDTPLPDIEVIAPVASPVVPHAIAADEHHHGPARAVFVPSVSHASLLSVPHSSVVSVPASSVLSVPAARPPLSPVPSDSDVHRRVRFAGTESATSLAKETETSPSPPPPPPPPVPPLTQTETPSTQPQPTHTHDQLTPADVATQLNIFTAANKPTAAHDVPVVALTSDASGLHPALLEVHTTDHPQPSPAAQFGAPPPVPHRAHEFARRRSITQPVLGPQQDEEKLRAQQAAKLAPVAVPAVPTLSRMRSAWVMLRSLSDGAHIHNGTITEKLEEEGISIISDIDDTIKVTEVHSSKQIIMNTFLRTFTPVPGMAELYRRWRDELKAGFHYVSASPFHLYTAISNFLVAENFPAGSVHLRKVESMSELFEPPRRTKRDAIHALMKAHPKRRFVFVGDSSEADPEIFSELAAEQPRGKPPQIIAIFIRRVASGWANNSHERFRSAFVRVRPETMCAAFSNPHDADQLLRKHLQMIGVPLAPPAPPSSVKNLVQ